MDSLIESVETWFLGVATELYNAWDWLGVGLLMAIESTAVPLPSEVIMPLAGWNLVLENGLGIWGILWAGLVGALGSVIGALVEYWIAFWGGRALFIRYGKFLLITKKEIDKTEVWFQKYGVVAVFLLRFVPGVRGLVAIPAGVAKMNVFVFAFVVFLASLPWTTLLAWAGYVLGDNYTEISSYLRPFYIPIAVVCALVIIYFFIRRIRTIRNESGYDA